jgi:hypothetical protein
MKQFARIMLTRSGLYLVYMLLAATALSVNAQPPAAQATVTKFSLIVPIAGFVVPDFCTGDQITFTSGSVLLQSTTTVSGDRVSVEGEVTEQGVKGTGSPSGLSYIVAGRNQFTMSGSTSAFPVEMTFTFQSSLIAPGTSDSKMTETLHLTINANGTTTASVSNFGVVCAP